MRKMTAVKVALAFVGLIVGAGFATGQEMIQYFTSFGAVGIWGAVISGLLVTAAGSVTLLLGSYFMAESHSKVFGNVAHPWLSRFLDWSVTFTLFSVGFVMIAGAGSTLEQQFGLPTWIGAGLMTLLVLAAGQLGVDRVSSIISGITPLVVIAILAAFVWTMFDLPQDLSQLSAVAQQAESPVRPWWVSAMNYTGMNLMVAVSMCLVIGGSTPNTREAVWGGFSGGLLYMILVLMVVVLLYLNIQDVGQAEVPMLSLFESIHPAAAAVMVVIVYLMIFNTVIGLFYALGRRLTVRAPHRYRPVFLLVCLVGYALSFLGFSTLMSYIYPLVGYIGMLMIVVFIVWWVRRRVQVGQETGRRDRIRALLRLRDDPKRRFTARHERKLAGYLQDSSAQGETLTEALDLEVIEEARARCERADGGGTRDDGRGRGGSSQQRG
ncbi:MAG: hypothetical protein L0H00_09990 [Micrococcales bacterium]|nr:hypothetical protein [Micrococcales bacterium]MDN5703300.1 hypothetical protein [Micrococcales bacterium]